MEGLERLRENELACGACGSRVGEDVCAILFRPDQALPDQRVYNECDCPCCKSLLLLDWFMN